MKVYIFAQETDRFGQPTAFPKYWVESTPDTRIFYRVFRNQENSHLIENLATALGDQHYSLRERALDDPSERLKEIDSAKNRKKYLEYWNRQQAKPNADIYGNNLSLHDTFDPIWLNEFAYSQLHDVLIESCDCLELKNHKNSVYLYHPTFSTEALDLEFVNLRSYALPRPVRFHTNRIQDKTTFCVPQCPGVLLLTDKFVEHFKSINPPLKGLEPILVWDSEDPDYHDHRFSLEDWSRVKESHREYLHQKNA
jgi:hypothetical protein